MADPAARSDRGSTIPLILGFFLLAMTMVAASIALGQAFVQQRGLQSLCDGAAAAAAAGAGDIDRGGELATGGSLRFAHVAQQVDAYLDRDPARRDVHVRVSLSPDHTRLTLRCAQTMPLVFGAVRRASRASSTRPTSTARSAVLG